MKKSLASVITKSVIALVIVAAGGAGYQSYKSKKADAARVRHVLAAVERGTLVTSISGGGQVSTSNQVDVKARASGEITSVTVKRGQQVKAGAVLAQIDSRDALKAVRDAEANLESATLALEKLKKPADALSVLQAENALIAAKDAKLKAEGDLAKAYEDGFNAVADAFLDIPDVMTSLHDVLFLSDASDGQQWNLDYYSDVVKKYDGRITAYRDDAKSAYDVAQAAYEVNFDAYKAASRYSDRATVVALVAQTYETSKLVAEALKSSSNFIQLYKDEMSQRNLKVNATTDGHLATIAAGTGTSSGHLSSLLSSSRALTNAEEAIVDAARSIVERETSLAKITADPEPLDIRSQELTVTQRQNALRDAREKLADYRVIAPFGGTVAEVAVKKGDQASNGGTIVTLITPQKIAEITLSEVDAALVKVGMKTTLTFDAIPELTITGEVSDIDTLGAVSQGVVSYGVTATFDTQDDRVKPGMSVTANVIVSAVPDVLLAPNAAVKGATGAKYVEAPAEGDDAARVATGGVYLTLPTRRITVEIGTTNDEFTEIVSGLEEGALVVTATAGGQAAAASSQSTGAIRIPGIGGGGGNFTRPAGR